MHEATVKWASPDDLGTVHLLHLHGVHGMPGHMHFTVAETTCGITVNHAIETEDDDTEVTCSACLDHDSPVLREFDRIARDEWVKTEQREPVAA